MKKRIGLTVNSIHRWSANTGPRWVRYRAVYFARLNALKQWSANTSEVCNRSVCVFTLNALNLKHLAELAPSRGEDPILETLEKIWQI